MRRGEIFMADWEPSLQGEPAFSRPAVILTNNEANARLPHLVVAPITSNTERLYPFDVLLVGTCGLSQTSKVQLNYIRGLNRSHLGKFMGSLTHDQLQELGDKLRTHLAL